MSFYRLMNGPGPLWYDGTRFEEVALRLGGRVRLLQVSVATFVLGWALLIAGLAVEST